MDVLRVGQVPVTVACPIDLGYLPPPYDELGRCAGLLPLTASRTHKVRDGRW